MKILSLLIALMVFVRVSAQEEVPVLTSIPVVSGVTPVIFLDMDGYQVEDGTRWSGYTGGEGFYAEPAGMPESEMYIAYHMVAEDFRPFEVAVTTDSNVYAQAPFDKRIRVVFTVTAEWFSNWNGGVAYYESFAFGDDTPVWVFSRNLGFSGKFTGDCASHEAGHSLNLVHHGTYDENCNRIGEYNYGTGEGETVWAPIMGATYYVNIGTWDNGDSIKPLNCANKVRNDVERITGYVNFRDDLNGGTGDMDVINVQYDSGIVRFTANGIIERRRDWDSYEVTLPAKTNLKLTIQSPLLKEDMGFANNLDIKASLWSLSSAANPSDFAPFDKVGITIDTVLEAGTYFIEVGSDGNANMSDYGSLGSFEIVGFGTTTPSALTVVLPDDTSMCLSDVQTAGYDLSVNVSANTGIIWSTGETTSSITVFEPGTYWVLVTNPNTQPTMASDTFTITAIGSVIPGFTVEGYNPDHCVANITIQDNTFSSCGNLSYVAYNYGLPGDSSVHLTLPGFPMEIIYDKPGTYVITQTVADIADNKYVYTQEIHIDDLRQPPQNIMGPDQKICDGALSTIGNSDVAGFWQWEDVSTHNPTRRVGPGEYIAFVELYDSNGDASFCYARDTITVTTSEGLLPNFTFNNLNSNIGSAIKFTNTTTTCDGVEPSRYRWIFGDGTESSEVSPSHYYRSFGPKVVTLIASTANSTETIEKIVNVNLLKPFPPGKYPRVSFIIPRPPVVNSAGSLLSVYVEETGNSKHFFQLIGVSGQIYRTGSVTSGTNLVDISSVARGIFFLRVFNNDKQEAFSLWKP